LTQCCLDELPEYNELQKLAVYFKEEKKHKKTPTIPSPSPPKKIQRKS